MAGVMLSDLIENAEVYSNWAVPLDPRLRRMAQVGVVVTGVAIPVALFCVPALLALAYSGWWVGPFFGGMAEVSLALLQSPLVLLVNGLALLLYMWLWSATDGLQAGPMVWHKVALALAGVGAFNLSAMAFSLACAVLSVAAIVLVVVGAIGVAILILFSLVFGGASR